MANKKNSYGEVVYSGSMIEDVAVEVESGIDWTGEPFMVVRVNGEMVTGFSVEKKRTGVIEVNHRITKKTMQLKDEGDLEPDTSTRNLD